MNNQKTISILSLGFILFSFNACAARPSSGSINFETLDANNDGKVVLQEFVDKAPSMGRSPEFIFNRLDTNGDGFISAVEFEKRRQGGGRP